MKILVVDDEPLINQYIVQCIRKADPAAEIVGAVTSGAKALQKLEEISADLVFADITMPKMDGIQLLGKIKKQYPTTDVIMLTCHDDFAYARAAIQNQASNYILKNEVNPASLREVLDHIRTSHKEKNTERATSHISRNQYLRYLIENDPSILPVKESDLRENHIYLDNRAFAVFLFYSDAKNIQTVQDRLPEGSENPLFYDYENGDMLLLLNLSTQETAGALKSFHDIEKQLYGAAGLSAVHHHLESLQRAIREAFRDRDQRFYQFSEQTMKADISAAKLEPYIMRAIIKIEDQAIEEGCAEIEKLLLFSQEQHPSVSLLKSLMAQTLVGIHDKLGLSCEGLEKHIIDSRTFPDFYTCVNGYLNQLRQSGKRYSEPIRKALDYIGFHYAEDISLNTVADFVYLNRDYLSRQFKKEVGVNFSEYLTSLRMKRAKHLLETTNIRISDVALSVGMSNMSYFSTVFHRSFGCTPHEARKQSKDELMSKM